LRYFLTLLYWWEWVGRGVEEELQCYTLPSCFEFTLLYCTVPCQLAIVLNYALSSLQRDNVTAHCGLAISYSTMGRRDSI
jgi:hypothetical protein